MILLLLSLFHHHTQHDSCDLIELNHFYDSRGNSVFDQVIFWEIDRSTRRYQVRGWQMGSNVEKNEYLYSCTTTSGVRVTSRQFRESWTQVDPEREDSKRHKERRSILEVKR